MEGERARPGERARKQQWLVAMATKRSVAPGALPPREAGCQKSAMRTWSNDTEAVARGVCAKMLAHDSVTEEQLAADVDMWWHQVAAELKCGVIEETGEFVGGKSDVKRKMARYPDWMRRHPETRAVWETARHMSPPPRN